MPYKSSNGNGNYWFSYDYGNVHMISLSTEECFTAECPMMIWLENDLVKATANRALVPWIVVTMHRPMYCSDKGTTYDNAFQNGIEELVIKHDVDFILQGHVHAYERIHPVTNYTVTNFPSKKYDAKTKKFTDVYEGSGKGPVYVVQGNTGAMQFESWNFPKPDWSAVRFANGYIPPGDNVPTVGQAGDVEGLILKSNYTDTFGFGVATFYNSTHMHYECIPITGSIGVDEFWIVKQH